MPALTLPAAGRRLPDALADPAVRENLESQLPAFLWDQRWFAGRGQGIRAVHVEHALSLPPAHAIVLLVIRVTDEAGADTRYQLPLHSTGPDTVDDALPSAAGVFRDILLAHQGIENGDVRLVPEPLASDAPCGGLGRAIGAEQSNTSVVFGDACILKLFRILQNGPNPDVQLTAWLSEQGGFPGVPRALAFARLHAPGLHADSAVLQEFLPNDGDGWSWVLERARAAFVGVRAPQAMDEHLRREAETLAQAAELGRLTARLHAALAGADTPGMRPEPATADDWDAWHRSLSAEAEETAAMLRAEHPDAAARIDALGSAPAPGPPAELGLKTRVHGDYHLGQILHTGRGWVVLDFEGEPKRPLAERIALQHPLVDVAGMLRSWDYAAHVAGEDNPAVPAWRDAVSSEYMEAYLHEARRSSRQILPTDDDARQRLLRLFLLRKALYEVRYEIGSRPDWIRTPLSAVEAMLEDTP